MTRLEAIAGFCRLATKVGGEQFNHEMSHDCMCPPHHKAPEDYRFSEEVMEFIEKAVAKAIGDAHPHE